jgi:hypothetical protein
MAVTTEEKRYLRKLLAILVGIAIGCGIALYPVKWSLESSLEITVINDKGEPQEGVEIYQEWSRTAFYNFDELEHESETTLTGKYGKVSFPERYYRFPIWLILKVEAVGCARYNVNNDNGSYSFFKVAGTGVSLGGRTGNYRFNNGANIRVVSGRCSDEKDNFCHYKCICQDRQFNPLKNQDFNLYRCNQVQCVLEEISGAKQVP